MRSKTDILWSEKLICQILGKPQPPQSDQDGRSRLCSCPVTQKPLSGDSQRRAGPAVEWGKRLFTAALTARHSRGWEREGLFVESSSGHKPRPARRAPSPSRLPCALWGDLGMCGQVRRAQHTRGQADAAFTQEAEGCTGTDTLALT